MFWQSPPESFVALATHSHRLPGGIVSLMFEAPAHAFRVSSSGAFAALRPVPPDPESDRLLLLDWCTAQAHVLVESASLFLVVRDTAATPDLHVDLLLLSDTGLLLAVLVNPASSPSPSVAGALAAAQWCESLKYDDLEELFNADLDEPRSLLEAFHEHFGHRADLPTLPSSLGRSYLVLLLVPHDSTPALQSLVSFLERRAIPVKLVEYAGFRADDEIILVVSPVGGELAPSGPKNPEQSVRTSTIGDFAAMVSDLDAEPSASTEELDLDAPARRRQKEAPS